ncbi:hypothetical protein BJ138DRAFT_1143199 [Hygrophoropsis aurantiaca]|uniref:Uncharacterized protein n=1 Tax=Hygrophoropsis aurantiaca TaxID=72124 RepID=A0ACB8ANA1_9AGAM|nr:hypothetical protein BJ138DRAFT_1143199 [Hygrophoropsis aurantiaca]
MQTQRLFLLNLVTDIVPYTTIRAMPVTLEDLPPELYSAILEQLPPNWCIVQQTLLSLTRAIPCSPVPIYRLFEHVRIRHPEQAVQLHRRLRKAALEASWVRDFALETWVADADVVVNLLDILPQISVLSLFIGPNFSPEHLQEIFEKPRSTFSNLVLRFRPYVQKATYYQFLKGAYYDTTLHALSRWPTSNIPTISIVQEPLDPNVARGQHFAQPLVFFRLDPLTALVCSGFAQSITCFRLRVPSRQVARFLCSSPAAAPGIELLDLSTCSVAMSDTETILAHFSKMKHLILDGCSIMRGEPREGEWIAVGKACALGPVKRAKEREKKLVAWLGTNALSSSEPDRLQAMGAQHTGRRIRPGRRGLATAAISLRASPPRDVPTPVVSNVTNTKIRIMPSLPALLSFSTNSPTICSDRYGSIRMDFMQGWTEGLAQLTAIRMRLRQSWRNNVRVVRFGDILGSEEGLDDLVDVEDEEEFDVSQSEGNSFGNAPALCLAGEEGESHTEHCGHTESKRVWKDTNVL